MPDAPLIPTIIRLGGADAGLRSGPEEPAGCGRISAMEVM
jgi:hypothetical protein